MRLQKILKQLQIVTLALMGFIIPGYKILVSDHVLSSLYVPVQSYKTHHLLCQTALWTELLELMYFFPSCRYVKIVRN